MNLYRVFPEPRHMLPVDDDSTRELLDQWYQPVGTRSCRLTLISSSSGRLVGPDGTSYSLSNPADKLILRTQRALADAIVTGAATVRAEAVPIPSHAPLVIVTSSGDLAKHQVSPTSFRENGVVIVSREGEAHRATSHFPDGVATHLTLPGEGPLAAAEISDALSREGYQHLLIEGGKQLATLFGGEGALDEVCLAMTGPPLDEGHPPLPWWDAAWGEWTSTHVLSDDLKTLYFRYVRAS